MKCSFCPNTIDEQKTFAVNEEGGQRAHAAELSKWSQLRVTLGNAELLTDHVCPSHPNPTVSVTLSGKSTAAPASPVPPASPAASGSTNDVTSRIQR